MNDYLRREKVIDKLEDVLERIGCDDDDRFEIIREIEVMPSDEPVKIYSRSDVDCGWK